MVCVETLAGTLTFEFWSGIVSSLLFSKLLFLLESKLLLLVGWFWSGPTRYCRKKAELNSMSLTLCLVLLTTIFMLLVLLLLLFSILLLLLFMMLMWSVEHKRKSVEIYQNFNSIYRFVSKISPENSTFLSSTIDICGWSFSFWLHVDIVTITVLIMEDCPVTAGFVNPLLKRLAAIILFRTFRSGRTSIM